MKQKRSELQGVKNTDPAKDDAAFAKIHNEAGCDEYMQKYPQGKHLSEVLAMKVRYQEARESMELELRREMEAEAGRTAYMDVQRIEFANYDANNNVLNDFDTPLYAAELKYLIPKIVYNGIFDMPQRVSISCKLYDPNGRLMTAPDSPSGYTFTNSFLVRTTDDNSYELSGYGTPSAGTFVPGEYVFELWYQDAMFYQTTVDIKDKGDAVTQDYWRRSLAKCFDNTTQSYKAGSYKGQLKGYDRSGLGMYSWDNGSYYIGEWKAKAMDGYGMYISAPGFDIMNCSQCEYYVGEWHGNGKIGMGRCYDKFGNLIYQGKFANDAPAQTYPNETDESMKFECKDYSYGCYYIGETKNGKCHGKGMLIWRYTGELWYGDFVNGERIGYGIYMPYEGDVSTGYWKGDEEL